MHKYVILLRGVNVGGKNLIAMKELKVLLESNGFHGVQTYIQSGNIVLSNETYPRQKIVEIIESEFGFLPTVLVLSEQAFLSAVSSSPYSKHEAKTVHFYFCDGLPKLDAEKLDKLIAPTERVELVGHVFYLHAPDGIGRSKLVASIESCLGTAATGRNLNTVNKLVSLL